MSKTTFSKFLYKAKKRRTAEAASRYYHVHDFILSDAPDGSVRVTLRKNPKDIVLANAHGERPIWLYGIRSLITSINTSWYFEFTCHAIHGGSTIKRPAHYYENSFDVRVDHPLNDMYDGDDAENEELKRKMNEKHRDIIKEKLKRLIPGEVSAMRHQVDVLVGNWDDDDIPF
jgi:hypothetical protein